ncbi:MAG: winged helix-turn-helix domain-containing protein [Planctomycetota bacterium]
MATQPATKNGAGGDDSTSRWTFLTNHAHVLIALKSDPTQVLREVAAKVGITERAVQRIVHELEEAGILQRERVGRRNEYRVLPGKNLRHRLESHCTVDELLDLIVSRS